MADVVDLRSRGEHAEVGQTLGAGLSELFTFLMEDPNDPVRRSLMANLEQAMTIAESAHEARFQDDEAMMRGLEQTVAALAPPRRKDADPESIINEMMALFPESEEAQRARQVGREVRGRVTPEDEAIAGTADLERQVALAREVSPEEWAELQAAPFRLEGLEAEDLIEQRRIMQESGYDPAFSAYVAGLGKELEAQGLEMDLERQTELTHIWMGLPERERQLFAVDPQYYAQFLLSEQNFDHQMMLLNLRSSLESAQDPREVLKADTLWKMQVMDGTRKIFDDIQVALEEGDRSRVEPLIEQWSDLNRSLLHIDPSAAIEQAIAVRGLFGGIKDLEFEIGDFLDTPDGAQLLEYGAKRLRRLVDEEGLEWDEAVLLLRDADFIRNDRTGVPNDRLWEATKEAARRLEEDPNLFDQEREIAVQEAALGIQNRTPGPGREEIEALEAELREALEGEEGRNIPSERVNELRWELKKNRLINHIRRGMDAPIPGPLGGGDLRLRRDRDNQGGGR